MVIWQHQKPAPGWQVSGGAGQWAVIERRTKDNRRRSRVRISSIPILHNQGDSSGPPSHPPPRPKPQGLLPRRTRLLPKGEGALHASHPPARCPPRRPPRGRGTTPPPLRPRLERTPLTGLGTPRQARPPSRPAARPLAASAPLTEAPGPAHTQPRPARGAHSPAAAPQDGCCPLAARLANGSVEPRRQIRFKIAHRPITDDLSLTTAHASGLGGGRPKKWK